MNHLHPLPSDPATALPLVAERLHAYAGVVDEFRETMVRVQQQLAHVATGEQVEAMRREVLAKVDDTARRLDATERDLLSMRLTLHGPVGQPELGLIARFGAMAERVKEGEKKWDRVIGYVIGAAGATGLTVNMVQQLLSR